MTDFESLPEFSASDLLCAVKNALAVNKSCLSEYTDKFKYSHSENGIYPATENVEWTTGFWTGELWLSYELSHDEAFMDAAMKQVALTILSHAFRRKEASFRPGEISEIPGNTV